MSIKSVYQARIAEIIRNEERMLGQGKAKDWEDYRKRVGCVEGLSRAFDVFCEVYAAFITETDELEDEGI